MSQPKTRAQIIAAAVELREEIAQTFRDAAHWNDTVRREHEAKIDPDPHGVLTRIAGQIDTMLQHEQEQLVTLGQPAMPHLRSA